MPAQINSIDEKISIETCACWRELPAAVITEAVCRYVPGFVGKQESVENDRTRRRAT
jgi:tRNA G37 N-methylase TrmD